MEVTQTLHMKKGQDSTSYCKNSLIQRKTMLRGSWVLETAIVECLKATLPQSMGIADLGCASGTNSLVLISNMVKVVHSTCSKMGINLPELRVSLNDLPSNDFNSVFMSLPEIYDKIRRETGIGPEGCFVSCVAGSFYGRLFPAKSLHFFHSSNSLHWLSKVSDSRGLMIDSRVDVCLASLEVPESLDPNASEHLNKGKVHISKTSPSCVLQAYISQFEKDFFLFLRSRSTEMVSGGRMVLVDHARTSVDATTNTAIPWHELMAQTLMIMASEGLVKEEKIDSFNLPYYAPSLEEVKNVIEQEGSFSIAQQELFEVNWKEVISTSENLSMGQQVSNAMRAIFESLLESQFGSRIIDEMFARIAVMDHDYIHEGKFDCLVSHIVRNS